MKAAAYNKNEAEALLWNQKISQRRYVTLNTEMKNAIIADYSKYRSTKRYADRISYLKPGDFLCVPFSIFTKRKRFC